MKDYTVLVTRENLKTVAVATATAVAAFTAGRWIERTVVVMNLIRKSSIEEKR